MKTRNEAALKFAAIALAALTYAGAVVYGDVQFLTVMEKAFPSDGVLRALAVAGAVMTAASALTLPIALHWWFSPGKQFLWGLLFWGLDIAVLGLNSILAYALAIGGVDGFLASWRELSPATPLLAVIGWGIAFLLDQSHATRHAELEMQADLNEIYAERKRQAAKSEAVYSVLLDSAIDDAREYAEKLGGRKMTTPPVSARAATPPSETNTTAPTAKADAPKPKATPPVSAQVESEPEPEPIAMIVKTRKPKVNANGNGNGNGAASPFE